ncbi:YicC/YloC family endoribonuclease [Legionella londiniensis]|uniref:Putative stress-induced protein n=1 Tax=Legionella londiniensis TaxID=45068 RepID=A0A0W0VRH1_9GAMM|nr:YicC/YloC family endoribonuclease [Legionella londiniensis]KTD22602.1 putative stress-induced protein [Legionella londiniensis]STX92533.1 putative stress-induced protein [Legionella londiniensis]
MTYSMTAFSRVENQIGQKLLCWEIKSVNHRYLDASFRLPEAFRMLEAGLREKLRGQIHRGKLDCFLKISGLSDENQPIVIHDTLIRTMLDAGSSIAMKYGLANDLTLSQVLNWPGAIEVADSDGGVLAKDVLDTFAEALKQLLIARETEGRALDKSIQSRLALLKKEVRQAKEETSSIALQQREKLQNRLDSLQMAVDKSRLEQEIALLITRLDVSEELDRLDMHIHEVSRTLQSAEPVGRRLDFLMQELNREANTLSSKSDSALLTKHAVEMKVLIEQMREQIQNIE